MFIEVQQQLSKALSGLKSFQLATVDRLIEQFSKPEHSKRMLVADEVGLGKTIVAKGVIAKLLAKHLQNRVDEFKPFRVTYICSNLALADENRQKLALFKGKQAKEWVKRPSFSRLVELSVSEISKSKEGKDAVIEVCTLTPTTSFTLTSGSGNCHERAIISVLLSKLALLSGFSTSIMALFKTDQITKENRWEKAVEDIQNEYVVNSKVLHALDELMAKPCEPKELQDYYCSYYQLAKKLARSWRGNGKETAKLKRHYHLFRIEIRKLVARCCAASLEADLFILDEFQRFQSLTDSNSESEESLIAQQVFHSTQVDDKSVKHAKVLLLSATPFKAITMLNEEQEENSHHQQLHNLLKFISKHDHDFIDQYESSRDKLHREVLALSEPDVFNAGLTDESAREVERLLQEYICRTERSQISEGFEQLIDSKKLVCTDTFSIEEVKAYRAIETLKERLTQLSRGRVGAQLVEFAKSAPWCMSFLHGYAFKKQFINHIAAPEIRAMLRKSKKTDQQYAWLSRAVLDRYALNVETDTPNAKVRAITKTVFEGGAENLLWTPPAKPYYPLSGVYKNSANFSKTLLFSSWAVVPRVLSSLWSYESDRRVLKGKGKKQGYYAKKKASPLLRFEGKNTLNTWHLLYPCQSLLDCELEADSLEVLLTTNQSDINGMLLDLKEFTRGNSSNNDWYILAPLLLDIKRGHREHVVQWLSTVESAASKFSSGDEIKKTQKGRLAHIKKIRAYIDEYECLQLGELPADLAKVLAFSAIANPALCSQRAIKSLWGDTMEEVPILPISIQFADLTSKLFNHEYAKPIVNRNLKNTLAVGNNKSPAWFKVLVYCLHGNFQSMLDEFCHMLASSGNSIEQAYNKLAASMGIRSAPEHVHFWEDRYKTNKELSSISCHFAVSMGTQKLTEDSGLQRVVNVRDAFNSPFRPFVLSSTSIGQEGLDFHWYCRRVVHWNLPNNPIDIEQREGRINRFKSYVIRKRLAEVTNVIKSTDSDIWQKIFEQVAEQSSVSKSGLEPYWYYPQGTTKIERIVPMYPMSKEVKKYEEMLKTLALYRLAFGQPRQEELLENLLKRQVITTEENTFIKKLMINLSPVSYCDFYNPSHA